MSYRAHRHKDKDDDDHDYEYHPEDQGEDTHDLPVEAYRQRRREQDRQTRHLSSSSSSSSAGAISNSHATVSTAAHATHGTHGTHGTVDKFQLERENRMARLRQEMRREDETLAALDQEQQRLQSEAAARAGQIKPQESIIEVKAEELEGLEEEEQMRKLLGFDGFGSTKGEAVEDNHKSAARGVAAKNKARKYRQYMNRKNGFNRPLEKID